MAPSSRIGLTAALALSGASALQIPLQVPLPTHKLPFDLWDGSSSSSSSDAASKPLIDSEALQARISSSNLKKRAEKLYEIAKLGEKEYNHPTRVIGSDGKSSALSLGLVEMLIVLQVTWERWSTSPPSSPSWATTTPSPRKASPPSPVMSLSRASSSVTMWPSQLPPWA